MRARTRQLSIFLGVCCGVFAGCDSEPLPVGGPGTAIPIRGNTDGASAGDAGGGAGAGGTDGGAGAATGTGGKGGAGGATTGTGGQGGTGNQGGTGGAGEGKMCGGIAGIRCEARLFCELDAAVCGTVKDASGICRVRSTICPDIYMPVCGCDGKTYGNDCERRGAGVSKKSDGACDRPGNGGVGASCGGFVVMPTFCDPALFCELPATTCNRIADIPGKCAEVPQACTLEYAPVCGCDGKTYGNDCARRAARVSLADKGPCATNPPGGGGKTCGGIAGIPCGAGFTCEFAPGTCGAADMTGVCREAPAGCTKEFVPVCGCDDKTYGNDCMRRAAGVSLLHTGSCR